MSDPLFSVVTPFHNTSLYLSQCIESVLAQTYNSFEYLLVDNCSTDGSGEIAARYASRDSRIRLLRHSSLLSQVQNYNCALTEISATSRYCKIVQADDCILPECLRLMVQAFEQSESIALAGSYFLKGDTVRGPQFPFPTLKLSGKEVGRMFLREGGYVFGSPTTVAYRSSVVRKGQPFFDESLLHEDTEKCMQILEQRDFGFVPQVLSFLRTGNESISSASRAFQPEALDRYIVVQRYASAFLDPVEATVLKRNSKREYYSALAMDALRLRERAYWQYHSRGLATLGETLDRPYLSIQIGRELLWMATNPGVAVSRVVRFARRRLSH